MAVYKLFFKKAASMYSENITMNTGKDEILEIGSYINNVGERAVVRSVVEFSKKELENIIEEYIQDIPYSASLELKLAEASEIPTDFTLEAYPVAQEWTNGTGKFNDVPTNSTGVSWENRLSDEQGKWLTSNFPSDITGSYESLEPGGGTWFIELNGKEIDFEKEFELDDSLDLSINITEAVQSIVSGSINNNGFLIKLKDDVEFGENLNTRLWYFSNDTNSIFPPCLSIGWDDSIYSTGSLSPLETLDIEVLATSLKNEYFENEIERVRLRARPRFPKRVFSTTSLFLNNSPLPVQAQWGLKSMITEEMVVPFSSDFTKISCDETGPFFDLFMQGLEPENYYKILIKVPSEGTVKVFDKGNVFKVVRHGK